MEKMRNIDRLIIYLLIILYVMVLWIVLWLDKDIDALNKTLEYITKTQEQSTAESSRSYSDYTYAMTEIENRLNEIENGQTEIKESLADTNEKVSGIETQVAQHEEAIKAIPTPKAVETSKKTNLTEKEIRMVAALVYLEAGDRNIACQRAVASVVINRMTKYHMTARQTVYQSGVFSVAWKVARTTPSKKSLEAVRYVCKNGVTTPKDVVAFRNRHYHTFGRRWKCIDGVYFTRM